VRRRGRQRMDLLPHFFAPSEDLFQKVHGRRGKAPSLGTHVTHIIRGRCRNEPVVPPRRRPRGDPRHLRRGCIRARGDPRPRSGGGDRRLRRRHRAEDHRVVSLLRFDVNEEWMGSVYRSDLSI